MRRLKIKLMTKFTAWLDPHLAKYRPEKQPFAPSDKAELIALLARTDEKVLGPAERNLIAGAMAFPILPVTEIMEKKNKLTFVHEQDALDPLTLDRLYKTRQDFFPVLDSDEKLTGLLKINDFEALRLTEDRVGDHVDRKVCFVRGDYSLEMLLATFLRCNTIFALVIDREENVIGYVTMAQLALRLFGASPAESFDADTDMMAVATRTQK